METIDSGGFGGGLKFELIKTMPIEKEKKRYWPLIGDGQKLTKKTVVRVCVQHYKKESLLTSAVKSLYQEEGKNLNVLPVRFSESPFCPLSR